MEWSFSGFDLIPLRRAELPAEATCNFCLIDLKESAKMTNETSPETNAFLADVANKLESAASNLESGVNATGAAVGGWASKYANANFASKLAYTACYTFSYGVCFPIFVACHYVPKNNSLVGGLVDGSASANSSVDQFMERARAARLARREQDEMSKEYNEIAEDGAGALNFS
jgi:hypothetical protein